MDELISSLEELTESVVARLQFISSEDLEAFVEERQHVIDEVNRLKLQTPFSPDQIERLKKILQADSIIVGRMAALKTEASDWLQQRGQAKMQRNAYEAAYTPDSVLMDRKK